MGSRVLTAPDAEPISLENAKLHLRVTGDDEDQIITLYLRSARRWVEEYIHRALIDQIWETTLDHFPLAAPFQIRLPQGRVSKISTIKYLDSAGAQQTLTGPSSDSPGTGYQEDLSSDEGAVIRPTPSGSWPQTESLRLAAVTVTFTAGYGPKASDVPESLVSGILYRLTDLHEFRGAVDGSGTESAKLEVQQYRLLEW